MRFVVYIDREGTTWPPPEQAPGDPVIIEVEPAMRFDDAVARALRAGDVQEERFYFWPHLLRDADEPNSSIVPFPRVAIADDGELIWSEGARDRMTLADLQRAQEAGFSEGDPRGVFLERPMYGDGVIPGWEDLLQWLLEFSFLAGVAQFVGILRSRYRRWRDRGARTPYAFLDLIVGRDEWDRRDLARLLGLSEQEATELLTSMGFEAQQKHPDRWTLSPDPNRSALRRKIIHDYLHSPVEEPEADDAEDDLQGG